MKELSICVIARPKGCMITIFSFLTFSFISSTAFLPSNSSSLLNINVGAGNSLTPFLLISISNAWAMSHF